MKKTVTDTITDSFNKLAHDYEHQVDSDSLYNTEYERPAFMALLPKKLTTTNVLDAGCAAGWYSEKLLSLGANVTAIDMSPEMVAATKRRVGRKAQVLCHDLSKKLPFKDESFGLIISSLTLHYIEDWIDTFKEFQRVLQHNGKLVFSVHHPFMDPTFFKWENYFETELLKDTWEKSCGKIDVFSYRRPLQQTINDTLRFFTIEQIIEPQPTKTFQDKNKDSYEYLMKNPHFLIIQASKSP